MDQPPQPPGSDDRADHRPGDDVPTVVLGDAGGPPSIPQAAVDRQIGRYRIKGELGRGGMGVVYEAHDPSLDRTVAIKLVRPTRSTPDARARLAREARVLAQLSHPNVVEVFEIGEHGDRLFIAMERVHGRDLRSWRDATPRSVAEICGVFIHAAAGLAAAHAVGLVHRDFKPDNVMVGGDGRVRVLDFGLARAAFSNPTADTPAPEPLDPEQRFTQTGLAMGTPAYMAPEQFRHAIDDPRTDQFAFGISLFEILVGTRPYPATTYDQLVAAVTRAELGTAADHGLPRPLFGVIRRILDPDPDARFPDMHAVIEALRAIGRPKARRWLRPAVAAATLGTAGLWWANTEPPRPPCRTAAQHHGALWGDMARTSVRDAILGTSVRYREATWQRVDTAVDHYASTWAAARHQACRDLQHERADSHADERIACLEDRRVALAAALDVLSRADDTTVHNAERTANRLPDIDACATAPWDGDIDTDSDDPQREAARQRLAVAQSHYHMGRYTAGLEALDGTAAGPIPSGPLLAASEFTRGQLHGATGHALTGAAAFERSYFIALETGQWDIACRAASLVATEPAVPYRKRWQWAGHAEAALQRHGEDGALRSAYDRSMCALQRDSGNLEQAIEHCERALAHADSQDPPDPATTAQALTDLGAVLGVAEDHERSYSVRERALELAERTWGSGHPMVATAANELGAAALALQDFEQAEALGARARRIRREVLGERHPDLVLAEDLQVKLLHARGRYAEAIALAERGLALRLGAYGENHPLVAQSLYRVALAQEKLGEHEAAIASMRRVAAIDEFLHPLDIGRIPTLREQARMAFVIGGGAIEGRPPLERAWEIVRESEIPDDHTFVRDLRHGYGETLLALGEAEQCLPYLERFVADPRPHRSLPHVKFVLAQALVTNDTDIDRALTLVHEALESWQVPTTDFEREETARMRAWLAAMK